MGRIIINAVLLLIVHEIILPAAASGKETCQLNRHMEEQCGPHTYKIVKPLLDYFREIRNELHQSEIKIKELNTNLIEKDREIVRIQEKLKEQAFHLDKCKMRTQKKENELRLCNNEVGKLKFHIHSQETTIDRLTPNSILFESYDKCKKDLADKSKNMEASEDIQTKLLKKENNVKLGQADIEKLNRTAQNIMPSSCIPFGKNPGVHQIEVSGFGSFEVLCNSNLAGLGWIVIQQRVGGKENFNRSWVAYREGFGSLESDFFLGLKKIHSLTSSRRHELFLHLVGSKGNIKSARYDDFKVSDEDHGYAMSLGKFDGDVRDALRDGENMKFSTFDRDNDLNNATNCAKFFASGWWYNDCYLINFNVGYGTTLLWEGFFRLKQAKMLIRPIE